MNLSKPSGPHFTVNFKNPGSEALAEKTISVLIVDDSALMRNLVSKFFDQTPDIQVAGKAMNGIFALKKIETLKPDVIILDLEMPEMNGIEFLKSRKKRGIEIPVIILSSLARKGARITMEALSLGASDFILKPSGTESQGIQKTKEMLIQLVRIYGDKFKALKISKPLQKERIFAEKPMVRPQKPEPIVSPPRAPKRKTGPIEIIAIGISTGGPNALREVFPRLEKTLPAPILVVQHMPAGFTEEFANSLDKISQLEVKEAEDGDIIKPGRILIAPGDRHLEIESKPLAKIIRLSDLPPVNGHRPSAGVLFRAVSRVYGNRSLAIIMTGMGKDGAGEIGEIYLEGGLTLAQDEATSIVFGMPKVAIELGYIHKIVPLSQVAEMINTITREYSA